MIDDDVPHDVEGDAEIVVNDAVAHSGDVLPGYLGMRVASLRRHLLHGLAHDLEITDDGVLRPYVGAEALLAVLCLEHDALDASRM